MQINNALNNKELSFSASLKLSGKKFPAYLKKNKINNSVIKEMSDKFEKATIELDGIMELDFGSNEKFGTIMSRIRYTNGNKADEILVFLENEKLSSDDNFVNKLVKMFDVFKMREKNYQKIENLRRLQHDEVDMQKFEKRRYRIFNLFNKTRKETYKVTIELFDIPYSSGCCNLGL